MPFDPPVKFPKKVRYWLRVMWAAFIGIPLLYFGILAIVGDATGCNIFSAISKCYVLGQYSEHIFIMGFYAPVILVVPFVVQIKMDNIYRKKNDAAREDRSN